MPKAHKTRSFFAVLVASSTMLTACGGASSAPPPTTAAGQGAPAQPEVEVPEVVVSPYDETQLRAQFALAQDAFLRGENAEAAAIFDKLVRLAPADQALVPPSIFNAGLAYQALGDHGAADARFTSLIAGYSSHPAARNARVRRLRSLAYLERWNDLTGAAEAVLTLTDLTPLERVEAHGARALGLVETDRVEEGARAVGVAEDIIESNQLGKAGTPPVEVAQTAFARGEVRRKRSEAIGFNPVPVNFADVLEQRCQGLLDAQAAYTEAMRSLDAHWSAMAGYRVGQLYAKLHEDVMHIPPPQSAQTAEQKALFVGAMRLRYRVLIEKGLKMMEATVRLGDRTGEASAWIGRAKEAQRDLEVALATEKAELAKLPYTEEELRAGLESLKNKKP